MARSSQFHNQTTHGQDSSGNYTGRIVPFVSQASGTVAPIKLQFWGLFPIGLSTPYRVIVAATHSIDGAVTLTYTVGDTVNSPDAGNTTYTSPPMWDAEGAALDFATNVVIGGNTTADITTTHVTGSGVVEVDLGATRTLTIDSITYDYGSDASVTVQKAPLTVREATV